MGKTIVNAIMAMLEGLVQFVTGGRIFVCVVLALLFLPITLGAITFLAVFLLIWYGLHIHLAVGILAVVVMVALACIHNDVGILPKYYYPIERYSYEAQAYDHDLYLTINKEKRHTYSVFILQALLCFLLRLHIEFFTATCIRRKMPYCKPCRPAFGDHPENNLAVYEVLTGIAWVWPAYIALGLGAIMALVYFVNTLIFGGAETVVSDIIHGPWLYLAGNF